MNSIEFLTSWMLSLMYKINWNRICTKSQNQFAFRSFSLAAKRISKIIKEPETIDLSKMPVPKVIATPRPFPTIDYPQISLDSLIKEASFHSLSKETSAFLANFRYPMDMEKYLKLVNGNAHFLLKESTKNFIQNQIINQPSRNNVILLDGIDGIGKSVTLMHTVSLVCQMPNWIVMYIPNAFYWVGGYFHYQVSSKENGLFDQCELAVHFLNSVLALNGEKIANFPPLEKTAFGDCKTLSELFEFAMKPENLNHSIEVVKEVFNILGQSQDYSILLAVDQFNAFYADKTEYFNQESRPLRPDEFTLLRIFLDTFAQKSAFKGCILGANCQKVRFLREISSENISEALPNAQKHSILSLEIGETRMILEHFKKLGVLHEQTEGAYLKKKHFVSGGIPEILFKCILYDNVY